MTTPAFSVVCSDDNDGTDEDHSKGCKWCMKLATTEYVFQCVMVREILDESELMIQSFLWKDNGICK